ncbi:MAG: glycosyltransferase family 2 protein [Marmoricola sp.]
MRWGRGAGPLISVVVPVYAVEAYLPACLDSLLGQRHRALDVVVVDDGSPDSSGRIAEEYAARDDRVRVVHVDNGGLGSARNVGVAHARGELLAFADSDDVVPPGAYAALSEALRRHGTDLALGDVLTLREDGLHPMPWLQRLHAGGPVLDVAARPALLGDVFAWNKLWRREAWDAAGLRWPEGVRYEDQPTTTAAFLAAGRVAVAGEPVYHWRIRHDGSSITQQRGTAEDLRDRWRTKEMALATVAGRDDPALLAAFRSQVLAGDLWRYFELVPEADDAWWALLVEGVRRIWGAEGPLDADLPPVHRLLGWLVAQDRRDDAVAVAAHRRAVSGPLPRVRRPGGRTLLDVPVLSPGSVPERVLELRPEEA